MITMTVSCRCASRTDGCRQCLRPRLYNICCATTDGDQGRHRGRRWRRADPGRDPASPRVAGHPARSPVRGAGRRDGARDLARDDGGTRRARSRRGGARSSGAVSDRHHPGYRRRDADEVGAAGRVAGHPARPGAVPARRRTPRGGPRATPDRRPCRVSPAISLSAPTASTARSVVPSGDIGRCRAGRGSRCCAGSSRGSTGSTVSRSGGGEPCTWAAPQPRRQHELVRVVPAVRLRGGRGRAGAPAPAHDRLSRAAADHCRDSHGRGDPGAHDVSTSRRG